MSDPTPLLYTTQNAVARITINRELQRNALNPEAIALFLDALDQAENDKSIRAILVTGSGDKAFCTGADLGSAIASHQDALPVAKNYARLLYRLATCPKPTLAMVKGFCLAGGIGLMLACDLVMAEESSRFGTPEVNVGLFPMMIGALIFRNVPRKKAMEMILTGRMISSSEAVTMGLVTSLAPKETLEKEVDKMLETLASKSPMGLKMGKEAFAQAQEKPLEEALYDLSEALVNVIGTQDAAEGISAFKEKRKPQFIGA